MWRGLSFTKPSIILWSKSFADWPQLESSANFCGSEHASKSEMRLQMKPSLASKSPEMLRMSRALSKCKASTSKALSTP